MVNLALERIIPSGGLRIVPPVSDFLFVPPLPSTSSKKKKNGHQYYFKFFGFSNAISCQSADFTKESQSMRLTKIIEINAILEHRPCESTQCWLTISSYRDYSLRKFFRTITGHQSKVFKKKWKERILNERICNNSVHPNSVFVSVKQCNL